MKLGKFGAHGGPSVASSEAADARSVALNLMSRALDQLDRDGSVPAIIGAHLQTAIDTLWASVSADQSSIQLH